LVTESEKRQRQLWLSRLAAGDHKAFADFVDRYKEMVFLCCRTLGLKTDQAEDAASNTFMAAYKGISRYRGQADIGTWLWGIAYRQAVNYLRKNHREQELLAEPDQQVADSGEQGPASAVEGREIAESVWQAVERLPRLWAAAIVLFYRENKQVKEIAKIMGTRENTVKTYLLRGRNRLKELLAGFIEEGV
jgi:RNA polymerase sigma-70 factor (ECF subfamily)